MPLDNGNYISEFNLSNPVGNIDKVSQVDDFIREVKKMVKQSFPNINKQARINSDELNFLKDYIVRVGANWDMKNSSLYNVAASDNSTAVQPRSYNDDRYLIRNNNLGDVPNKSVAVQNLMGNLDTGSSGYANMRTHVVNMVYPVGSIYENYSRGNNPRDFFGTGTWAAWAQGRVRIGNGQTQDERGETRNYGNGHYGGAFMHQLSEHEMPSHNHGVPLKGSDRGGNNAITSSADNGQPTVIGSNWAGGNGAHNNMQPFVSCFVWVRTA